MPQIQQGLRRLGDRKYHTINGPRHRSPEQTLFETRVGECPDRVFEPARDAGGDAQVGHDGVGHESVKVQGPQTTQVGRPVHLIGHLDWGQGRPAIDMTDRVETTPQRNELTTTDPARKLSPYLRSRGSRQLHGRGKVEQGLVAKLLEEGKPFYFS